MKKKINKSELIRSLVAKNPSAKAAEIVALLKKDGVAVSQPLVYSVMNKSGDSAAPKAAGKKRGRKPGSKAAAAPAAASANTSDLFAAMQSFVNAAGGLDKAIEILSVFKK